MRAAVIGIGSNSLRLLVADVHHRSIKAVLRERIGLRVFASLNGNADIDETMIHNACEAVLLMKIAAHRHGAETIYLFATSAVRDARNKAEFAEAIKQKTGIGLDILSGQTEARLSYLGVAGDGQSGMLDIGGGSTEIVIGDQSKVLFSCSLQAGAVRLYQEFPINNAADIKPVSSKVQALLNPYMDNIQHLKTPAIWAGVGGTLTASAACVQDIAWNSETGIHGFVAEQEEIRRITHRLAGMTADKRRTLRCIPLDRADIIVHGFVIMLACMEQLEIQAITVSTQTNLDGYLKIITAAG